MRFPAVLALAALACLTVSSEARAQGVVGTQRVPTRPANDNSTAAANTAYVDAAAQAALNALATKAPIASPSFTGTATIPAAALGALQMKTPSPLDTTLAGTINPNAIMLGAGNRVSFCPALSCIVGAGDTPSVPDARFQDHQRTSLLLSSETHLDAAAEEQTLAVTTTIKSGYVKPYAASASYSVGDNTAVGNATYRAIVAGTTGANSAPQGARPTKAQFDAGGGKYIVTDGTVQWQWINDYAIGAKLGTYLETRGMPGAGYVSSLTSNSQLMSGVTPTFFANFELDTSNNSGTDCVIGTNCYGLWLIQGGTNYSTAGLYISSDNTANYATLWAQRFAGQKLASASMISIDTSGSNDGISFGGFTPASFSNHAIFENSTTPVSIQISGSKSISSIIDDATSPAALNIAGSKSLAGVYEHSTTPAGVTLNGTYSRSQIEGVGWAIRPSASCSPSRARTASCCATAIGQSCRPSRGGGPRSP